MSPAVSIGIAEVVAYGLGVISGPMIYSAMTAIYQLGTNLEEDLDNGGSR